MTVGTRITFQKLDDGGNWKDYLTAHLLRPANKHVSRELYEAGGEQDIEKVDFTVRWRPALEPIEFDKPSYRIVWRGHAFDIQKYDDYMYQHRRVTFRGAAHG